MRKAKNLNELRAIFLSYNNKKAEKFFKGLYVKDFEDAYLCHGKFVYPDSIPFHSYTYGETLEISDAEKMYLEKYKDVIEKAKKEHLMD